jgi:hypothetical protein
VDPAEPNADDLAATATAAAADNDDVDYNGGLL